MDPCGSASHSTERSTNAPGPSPDDSLHHGPKRSESIPVDASQREPKCSAKGKNTGKQGKQLKKTEKKGTTSTPKPPTSTPKSTTSLHKPPDKNEDDKIKTIDTRLSKLDRC